MYESEVDGRTAEPGAVPEDIRRRFGELKDVVTARTLLPWGEHCTECAMPACFQTCALYDARPDGKCRRFANGFVRLDGVDGLNPYLLGVTFRRWGQLHTVGHTYVHDAGEAAWIERRDLMAARILGRMPLPERLRRKLVRRRSREKERAAGRLGGSGARTDYFLVECWNPATETIAFTMTVRPKTDGEVTPFQIRLGMEPGFNRHRIPTASIGARVNLDRAFVIDLMPNGVNDHTALWFGALDFVVDPTFSPHPTRRCKCVVWDLDHTLWDGTLVEDGLDALVLKPGIADVMRTLDERGILHSVVSKNDPGPAMAALRRFGLDELILEPQISWDPKGAMVARVADRLDIGRDTLVFLDDSPFERAEVQSVCPEVLVLDAAEYATLPDREELRVPVTEESRRRRLLYRDQSVRTEARSGFDGDYLAFLRECELVLTIGPVVEGNLPRVHELTQRTNQMNFSGRRYTVDELRMMASAEHLDTYVMHCRDRFGDYGTIGFGCIDSMEPRLVDLTFSCRVQSKRIEHAFLTHALRRYLPAAPDGFLVTYRRTERNAAAGRVFEDFGMETVRVEDDGTRTLRFTAGREVPDDGLVTLIETDRVPSS